MGDARNLVERNETSRKRLVHSGERESYGTIVGYELAIEYAREGY